MSAEQPDLIAGLPPVTAKPRAGDDWNRAYARRPGSGPQGETCGTCLHIRRKDYRHSGPSKWCFKCALSAHPCHGAASDIRMKTAACSKWQPKESSA